MKVVWDARKAATSAKFHGVTFEEAQSVLLDPFALTREDDDAQGEQRFVTLGVGERSRVLVVVFTYRAATIRLISAWKANEAQRRRYENQFRPDAR